MLTQVLGPLITLISGVIDKAIPDKDEAEKLKAQITLAALDQSNTELKGAVDIIVAEANGDSWLQRSWRPLLMLWFAALVGAHWLGFTPDTLPESVVINLLDIVQIGIGGYVLGRSGEKMVKAYKQPP